MKISNKNMPNVWNLKLFVICSITVLHLFANRYIHKMDKMSYSCLNGFCCIGNLSICFPEILLLVCFMSSSWVNTVCRKSKNICTYCR